MLLKNKSNPKHPLSEASFAVLLVVLWLLICTRLRHGVDSVIERSLLEIIGSKNFALINLSSNFHETEIYDKVFSENLVAAH